MKIRGALVLIGFAAVSLQAQVTFDRLLHTDREPQNWLTYSGNVLGQRYSLLNQITTTLNSHLIAVNAKVGKLIWDTTVTTAPGYPMTHVPLVVRDKIIVGTAGGAGP